ncbi:Yip1 domain-containing protein [Helicostylum pulchrum]|nr:Yip1 domain-containing protein [Helicostylum pulchrum]
MLSPASEQHENPFISSPVLVNNSSMIEPDLDLTGQSTTKPTPVVPVTDHNNIQPVETTSTYTGEDTLDEPVTVTIMRDLKKVAYKLLQVLHPNGDRNVLRDWDLWGPLLLCLTLAILLSVRAPDAQAVPIFTGVFVIVWLGAAIVTLNAKLLGGCVSFFQSVCVIGYCLFPIVVSAIVATFVKIIWVRLPVTIVSFIWSTYASVGFMSESQVHLENRRALAVYPLFLFYFIITWLVLIS